MTILELIEELEELEDLSTVIIGKNGVCDIYEGDDIDFISCDILNLPVKHYKLRSKYDEKHKYKSVYIET